MPNQPQCPKSLIHKWKTIAGQSWDCALKQQCRYCGLVRERKYINSKWTFHAK